MFVLCYIGYIYEIPCEIFLWYAYDNAYGIKELI